MSDLDKVETDVTSSEKQEHDVQKEEEKQADTAAPENGASNGLSVQLEEKIIRQVEVSWTTWLLLTHTLYSGFFTCTCVQFYFGDRNLPRDKFLQGAAAESEGGCIQPVIMFRTCTHMLFLW